MMKMRGRGPILTRDLSDTAKAIMSRVAKRLIRDVGQLPSRLELFEVAMHYRRTITDAELAMIPAFWMRLPAVHEAGRGIVLEENT